MIENIRKYTGLMIVVLVLLFIGLVFLGDGVKNSFGSKPAMQVAGSSVSQKEFDRNMAVRSLPSALSFAALPRESRILASHYLGDSVIDSPQLSAASVVNQMGLFLQSNSGPERFVTNRINIRKAGIEYGVTPSNDEVESFVENVLFADAEGNYDLEAYDHFIKNRVTNFGGTKGFNEYMKDLLTAQNLSRLLGGGIAPEMNTIRALYENQNQTITAQQITIEPGTYEAKITPTEEQIKEFYEENKADYNSDELRSISYVQIQPDWEKTLEKVESDKAEAAKLAEENRKKQEEATKAAEAEANAANQGDQGVVESEEGSAQGESTPPSKATSTPAPPLETATDAPAKNVPSQGVVEKVVAPEAKALITQLKEMAVYFDSSSAEIKASEVQKITEAAQLIVQSTDVAQGLTVGGYADLQGNADFNRDLSLKRANAVRDSLIAQGVPAARLTVNHFGEDTSKSAKDDLWKSRRVEISLTGPAAPQGAEGEEGEPGEQAPAPEEEPAQTPAVTTPPPAVLEAQALSETAKSTITTTPATGVQPTVKAEPTVSAPAAPQTQPTPPKSAQEKLNGAEKDKAVDALNQKVNEFSETLADNFGEDFEALASEAGYSVVTSELFAKSSPPTALEKSVKDNPVGSLTNAIFQLPAHGDSDEKMSDPHKTSDGWFIIRLDQVQEAVPLSYEDAKVKVTVDLKKKLAREMMAEDAKAIHEKLSAAIKEGQTFEEAAKAAEQTVIKKERLVAGQTYQGRSFGDAAFGPAKITNPGEMAPLKLTPSEEAPDSALIIYVEKREIEKGEQYNTKIEKTFSGHTNATRLAAFENWLNDRYKESDVIPPNSGDQQ